MKVVNVKHEKAHIMCDRTSVLGNPYHIGKDGDREQVILKYKAYLWNCIQVVDELNRIEEIDRMNETEEELKLGCHCKPKACHVDTIVKAIEYLRKRREDEK